MKVVYTGGTYRILCTEETHLWIRKAAVQTRLPRTFGLSPCKCEEWKQAGIRVPLTRQAKTLLNYHAQEVR